MKTGIWIALIICLVPFLAAAQSGGAKAEVSVSGKVLDDQGAGVAYAAVVVMLGRDSMIVSSTLTKVSGAFELGLADSLREEPLMVEVSCLRYIDKVVHCPLGMVDFPKSITLADASISEDIDEVVVAGKKTSFTRQGDRYVFRISPDLEIAKGSSIYDILKITPLVKVEQESITVSGAGSPQIYINGRRNRLSSQGLVSYLKSVPASSLSNIEVMPIANSTYYGEGNFSVIDINIKKNQGDGVGGMASLSIDQSHTSSQSTNINLNIRKRKVGINTSLWAGNNGKSRLVTENSMLFLETGKGSDNSMRSFSFGQNFGGDLTLDYDINDKQVIGFSVNAYYGQYTTKSTTLNKYSQAFGAILDSTYRTAIGGNSYNNSTSASLNYQLKVGDKGSSLNVELGYMNDMTLGRQTTIFDRLNDDMMVDYNLDSLLQRLPQSTEAWTGMARYDHVFGRWGTLSSGIDFHRTLADDDSYYASGSWDNKNERLSNHFVYTETLAALFVSYRVGWTTKFSTTLGGRMEYTHTRAEQRTTGDDANNYRMRFMPTLYLSYNFNDDNSLSYSASTRMSFPSYQSLNPFKTYSSPTHYSQGNPYLKPQRYFNESLDYNYKGKLSVTLSHYNSFDAPREFTTPDGDNGTKSEMINFGRTTQVYFIVGMMGSYFKDVWWPNNYLGFAYAESNGMIEDQLFVKRNGALILNLGNNFTISKKHNLSFEINYSTQFITKSDVSDDKPMHMLSINIKKGFGDFYISLYGYDILGTYKNTGYIINNGIKSSFDGQAANQVFGMRLSYSFGNSSVRSARRLGESSSGVKSRL